MRYLIIRFLLLFFLLHRSTAILADEEALQELKLLETILSQQEQQVHQVTNVLEVIKAQQEQQSEQMKQALKAIQEQQQQHAKQVSEITQVIKDQQQQHAKQVNQVLGIIEERHAPELKKYRIQEKEGQELGEKRDLLLLYDRLETIEEQLADLLEERQPARKTNERLEKSDLSERFELVEKQFKELLRKKKDLERTSDSSKRESITPSQKERDDSVFVDQYDEEEDYRPRLRLFSPLLQFLQDMNSYNPFNISGQYLLTLRRNQGNVVGDKQSYTTLEALSFPLEYNHYWPFIDARYHAMDSGGCAANLGIGVRTILPGFNQIVGANIYYDYRNAYDVGFSQIGFGLEMINCLWSCRLNGYLPVGRKKALVSFCREDSFEGSFFFQKERFADSLAGADFGVDALVARICCTDIYLGFGVYYYKAKKCEPDIYGTEYRLSAKLTDYLSFDLDVTHDSVFNTRLQGQLAFTVPFGAFCGRSERMFLPVRRREIIVLGRHNWYTWNF